MLTPTMLQIMWANVYLWLCGRRWCHELTLLYSTALVSCHLVEQENPLYQLVHTLPAAPTQAVEYGMSRIMFVLLNLVEWALNCLQTGGYGRPQLISGLPQHWLLCPLLYQHGHTNSIMMHTLPVGSALQQSDEHSTHILLSTPATGNTLLTLSVDTCVWSSTTN